MNAPKYEQDEEEQGFLRQREEGHGDSTNRTRSRQWLNISRLFVEFGMAVAIVLLLLRLASVGSTSSPPRPVPTFPRKSYTFVPDPKFVNDDMFADEHATLRTLHNWIELSAVGRGYVRIPEMERYNLSNPYTVQVDRDSLGPAYMMSVFHQLHCLSYLVEHYQKAVNNTEGVPQEEVHHSAHCFDYLRQSILCSGDQNLEGDTKAGPGWGSVHECVDYDALLDWANEHSTHGFRGNMPEESTL